MDFAIFQVIGAVAGFGTIVASTIVSYKKDGERLNNSTEKIMSNVSGAKGTILDKIAVGYDRTSERLKETQDEISKTQSSLQGLIGEMKEQKGKQEVLRKNEADLYQSIQTISGMADTIAQRDTEITQVRHELSIAKSNLRQQEELLNQKDAEIFKLKKELRRYKEKDQEWER